MPQQPSFLNPYATIADTYIDGVNEMLSGIVSYSSDATDEQLIIEVASYLQESYYTGTLPLDQTQQLQAVVGNIFNAYIGPNNPIAAPFTPAQWAIIEQTICDLKKLSINKNSGSNFFQIAQENIATSGLSTTEQAPLFMAYAIAEEAYNFFYVLAAEPTGDWVSVLDTNPAINLSNLSNWVIAIFRGALIGATQSWPVVPTNAPQGVGVLSNIVTAVGGALTLTFGEIVYHWVQKPQMKESSCNCGSH